MFLNPSRGHACSAVCCFSAHVRVRRYLKRKKRVDKSSEKSLGDLYIENLTCVICV